VTVEQRSWRRRDARWLTETSGGGQAAARVPILFATVVLSTDPTVDLEGSESSQRWPAPGCTTTPWTSRMMRGSMSRRGFLFFAAMCVIGDSHLLIPRRGRGGESRTLAWRRTAIGAGSCSRWYFRPLRPSCRNGLPSHLARFEIALPGCSRRAEQRISSSLPPADRASAALGAVIARTTGTREQFGSRAGADSVGPRRASRRSSCNVEGARIGPLGDRPLAVCYAVVPLSSSAGSQTLPPLG